MGPPQGFTGGRLIHREASDIERKNVLRKMDKLIATKAMQDLADSRYKSITGVSYYMYFL